MDSETFSVKKLLTVCDNPFVVPVWLEGKIITREGVKTCIERGWLEHPEKYPEENPYCDIHVHSARIAWLAENGWDKPIELDFGVPSLGYTWYPLLDGHHRLAAAVYRGDKTILGAASGDVEVIEEYQIPSPPSNPSECP
jgi:hypothetical protein